MPGWGSEEFLFTWKLYRKNDQAHPFSGVGGENRLVEGLVERLVESQRKIMGFIKANPRISKRELSDKVGISTTAIDKNINKLKDKGLLKRIGPDKGGHWEVIK